jgi:hypothetical protein
MSTPQEGSFDRYEPGALPDPDLFMAELEAAGDHPLDALWREQEARRAELFQDVRTQFGVIRDRYGTQEGLSWQAYYAGVHTEADMRTWIVGQPRHQLLHIILNREDRELSSGKQKLVYMEYVISGSHPLIKKTYGVAYRNAREAWSEEALQRCAVMQVRQNHIQLIRGAANTVPTLADQEVSQQEAEMRYQTGKETEQELTNVRKVLSRFAVDTAYHEPGVTGLFHGY